MKWNTFPEFKPKFSGPYLVSLKGKLGPNNYYFKAIAYFNINTNLWSKYDSFDFKNEVKELIEHQVLAWKKTGSTYTD